VVPDRTLSETAEELNKEEKIEDKEYKTSLKV